MVGGRQRSMRWGWCALGGAGASVMVKEGRSFPRGWPRPYTSRPVGGGRKAPALCVTSVAFPPPTRSASFPHTPRVRRKCVCVRRKCAPVYSNGPARKSLSMCGGGADKPIHTDAQPSGAAPNRPARGQSVLAHLHHDYRLHLRSLEPVLDLHTRDGATLQLCRPPVWIQYRSAGGRQEYVLETGCKPLLSKQHSDRSLVRSSLR